MELVTRRVVILAAVFAAVVGCSPFPEYLYYAGGHIDLSDKLLSNSIERNVFVVQDPSGSSFIVLGDVAEESARALIFDSSFNLLATKDGNADLINAVRDRPLPRPLGGLRTEEFVFDSSNNTVTDDSVNTQDTRRWSTAYDDPGVGADTLQGYYFFSTITGTTPGAQNNDTIQAQGYNDILDSPAASFSVTAFSDGSSVSDLSVNDVVIGNVLYVALHMLRQSGDTERVYSVLIRAADIANPGAPILPASLVDVNDPSAGSLPVVVTDAEFANRHIWTADGLIYPTYDDELIRVDTTTGAIATLRAGENADNDVAVAADPSGRYVAAFDPTSQALFRLDPWW